MWTPYQRSITGPRLRQPMLECPSLPWMPDSSVRLAGPDADDVTRAAAI